MRISYLVILMSLFSIGYASWADISAEPPARCPESLMRVDPLAFYRCWFRNGGNSRLSLLTNQIWFKDCVQREADAGKSSKDVTAACVPQTGLFEISDKTSNTSDQDSQQADASH